MLSVAAHKCLNPYSNGITIELINNVEVVKHDSS